MEGDEAPVNKDAEDQEEEDEEGEEAVVVKEEDVDEGDEDASGGGGVKRRKVLSLPCGLYPTAMNHQVGVIAHSHVRLPASRASGH